MLSGSMLLQAAFAIELAVAAYGLLVIFQDPDATPAQRGARAHRARVLGLIVGPTLLVLGLVLQVAASSEPIWALARP